MEHNRQADVEPVELDDLPAREAPSRLVSPNRRVVEQIQDDGNRVVLHDGVAVWSAFDDPPRPYPRLATRPTVGDAPSFLDMNDPVGNFLHPAGQYFPPATWVKSETALRERFAWLEANGYSVELAMLEQSHWGTGPGRKPEWTQPAPGTPLVYEGVVHPVYGWTFDLEELIRRITIARQEYGLEIVLSLWEQERIEHDFASALANTERVVKALDRHVVAFRNSWEQDEVLSLEQMHQLDNLIGATAEKPCGPHFANGLMGTDKYFDESNRANILWMQYDADLDEDGLARVTREMVAANSRVTVVADEHSPAVRLGSYTHAESRARGKACRDAGAVGGMNG